MTLENQFLTMLYMIAGGIYLGIALETYRRLSMRWHHNKFLVYCFEIIFWLIQMAVLFYILYMANSGELRLYVFLACLLGFSIYQVIFSALYKKILEQIIKLIKNLYQFIKRMVYILIILPIKWMIVTIFILVKFVFLSLLKILTILLLPFIWIGKFIYFLLPEKIQQFFNKTPKVYSIIENTLTDWVKYIKRR